MPQSVYYYDSKQEGDIEFDYYMQAIKDSGINKAMIDEMNKSDIAVISNTIDGMPGGEENNSKYDKYRGDEETAGDSDTVSNDLISEDGVRTNDPQNEVGFETKDKPNVFEFNVSSGLDGIKDDGEEGNNGYSDVGEAGERKENSENVTFGSGNESESKDTLENHDVNVVNEKDDASNESVKEDESDAVNVNDTANIENNNKTTEEQTTEKYVDSDKTEASTDTGDTEAVSGDYDDKTNMGDTDSTEEGYNTQAGDTYSENEESADIDDDNENVNDNEKTEEEQQTEEEQDSENNSISALEYEGTLGEYIWGEYPDLSELHIFEINEKGEKAEITDYNINMNYPELTPMKKIRLFDKMIWYEEDNCYLETYTPGEYYATVWYGDKTIDIPYVLNIYYAVLDVEVNVYCTNPEEHRVHYYVLNEDPDHLTCPNCFKYFEDIFGEGSTTTGVGHVFMVPLYYDYYLNEGDLAMYNLEYDYDYEQYWMNMPINGSKDSATCVGDYRYKIIGQWCLSKTYIPEDD